jgi:TolB-like protein/class 3 adenylate cyclase/Flp pilus assembly protein TadD
MAKERVKRKLSGILSADAVGYSRLMRLDEAATVATLKEYREVMATLIQKYRGRVVDSPGDNILAEFASVVDAVECAVEIQKELKNKNEKAAKDHKMEFRIGIHLGDVIEDEERIYGDGVNIAARIEGLANSGGICISRTTYDSIKGKLSFGYEYIGEHTVKNFAEPVRVYRVLSEPEAAGKVIGEKRFLGKFSRKTAMNAIIGLVIIAGGLIGWNLYLHQSKKVEPASLDKLAYPLPDKPSIAVLPFDNLSGDPKQEYFSDGITEEIITALAKVPDIFVMARNSTFIYKGNPVKIKQVSEDLGVRYVLEGSVNKAGDRVRITAQLIDAIKGYHLWAERYDGILDDVFKLQDKVTQKIVTALAVKLTPDMEENITDWGTKNAEAYDAYLQAGIYLSPQTPKNMAKAVASLKRAIELDPNFGRAHARLATAYTTIMSRIFEKDLGISNALSLRDKHLKLALKNPSAKAHESAAWKNIFNGEIDEAMDHAERAFTLSPNNGSVHITMGVALIYAGRPDDAIIFLEKAMRINPGYSAMWLWWLGVAQFCNEQMEVAATTSERARKRNPNLAPWFQIIAYEHLGRKKEAQETLTEYLKLRGWKEAGTIAETMRWYQFQDQRDRELLVDGLRKAGLK